MKDLLVSLYDLDFDYEKGGNILYQRLLSPNADMLVDFVLNHFGLGWASEIKAAIYKINPSCFVAVTDDQIIGFVCYDATAKGYLGPIGIDDHFRNKGVGKKLLMLALGDMMNYGYGYAIIGGVSDSVIPFYQKTCQAQVIDTAKNVYQRLIRTKK